MKNKVFEIDFGSISRNMRIPGLSPILYNKRYYKTNNNDDLFEHLLYLKRNSSLHGNIINDKIRRIYGSGLLSKNKETEKIINKKWNKIFYRMIADYETFGVCYLYIQWNIEHTHILDVKHIPVEKVRVGEDDMFFIKNKWKGTWNNSSEKPLIFPKFCVEHDTGGEQILEIKEYEPGGDNIYALPKYFSGIKAINCDINIITYFDSTVQNNFSSNTIIEVPDIQDPEKKKLFEETFKKKMTGPHNSGSSMIIYKDGNLDNNIVVNRLSNDIEANGYLIISDTVTQRILNCHSVPSPILYGIETPGSLGNSRELYNAEVIYESTVIAPVRNLLLEEILNLNKYLHENMEDITVESLSVILQNEDEQDITDSIGETQINKSENEITFKNKK